jgi:hypothetical protein
VPAHEHVNGAQFTTVFHPATPKSMGGVPHHTVEAWAPEHADSTWAKTPPSERETWEGSDVDPGTRPLSSLAWHHKTGEIRGVYTADEHRRQGLASSLYQEGNRIAGQTRGVPQPKHSPQRTKVGDAWAKSVGGRVPRLDQR